MHNRSATPCVLTDAVLATPRTSEISPKKSPGCNSRSIRRLAVTLRGRDGASVVRRKATRQLNHAPSSAREDGVESVDGHALHADHAARGTVQNGCMHCNLGRDGRRQGCKGCHAAHHGSQQPAPRLVRTGQNCLLHSPVTQRLPRSTCNQWAAGSHARYAALAAPGRVAAG